MEWTAVEDDWKSVSASLQKRWGSLTTDDLEYMDKSKEAVLAKVRLRTGLAQDTAERQLDELIASLQVSAAAPAKLPAPPIIPPSGAAKTQ